MTSCLGDPATNFTINNAAGVIGTNSSGNKVIYVKGGDAISSEDFQSTSMANGDCVLFDYAIDMASNENINNGEANGYLTATIYTNTMSDVSKWETSSVLTDTAKVIPCEQTISTIQTRTAYIQDNLFIFTEMSKHSSASVDSFSLSFNPAQKLGDDNVYNLYLRSVSLDTTIVGTSTMIVPVAFDIKSLVNSSAAHTTDNEALKFRINYLSSIGKDSTCVWKKTDVFTLGGD
jgi:hypothetical protein